jgi:hypothetical protein
MKVDNRGRTEDHIETNLPLCVGSGSASLLSSLRLVDLLPDPLAPPAIFATQ